MPLYLDRHDATKGLTAEQIAQMHLLDLAAQHKYDARYISYWFDPADGVAFCFVEAPTREAAEAVHMDAHGAVAARIIEVDPRSVTEFLGAIREPAPGEPLVQSGFRTIVFTDIEGSTMLSQRLGDAKATQLVRTHDEIVCRALDELGGSRVKHTGDGIMASFASAARAVQCAIAIQQQLDDYNTAHAEVPIRVRIGISAGEPVTDHDDLFGAAVALARRICDSSNPGRILVSSAVRELCLGKGFTFGNSGRRKLKGFQEPARLYEVRWREDA